MAARLRPLQAHPDTPQPLVRSFSAGAGRQGATLSFEYRVSGELEQLRLPAHGTARRRDGLWRHSCFEAFIAAAGTP